LWRAWEAKPVREGHSPLRRLGGEGEGGEEPFLTATPATSRAPAKVFAFRLLPSGFSFQPFSVSAFCFVPVEQRALGLLLARGEFHQARRSGKQGLVFLLPRRNKEGCCEEPLF
jgi:hypothetical protein